MIGNMTHPSMEYIVVVLTGLLTLLLKLLSRVLLNVRMHVVLERIAMVMLHLVCQIMVSTENVSYVHLQILQYVIRNFQLPLVIYFNVIISQLPQKLK